MMYETLLSLRCDPFFCWAGVSNRRMWKPKILPISTDQLSCRDFSEDGTFRELSNIYWHFLLPLIIPRELFQKNSFLATQTPVLRTLAYFLADSIAFLDASDHQCRSRARPDSGRLLGDSFLPGIGPLKPLNDGRLRSPNMFCDSGKAPAFVP